MQRIRKRQRLTQGRRLPLGVKLSDFLLRRTRGRPKG